jgi:hypothetical protein
MERNSRELLPLESLMTKTEFEKAKEDIWAELTRLDSAVAMVGNSYQLTYNDQFSNDELEGDAAPVDYFPDTQEEYTQGVVEIETGQPTVSKSKKASLKRKPKAIAVESFSRAELEAMTIRELKDLASGKLTAYGRMTKAELIEELMKL